jgi:hypothetical protein
VLRVDAIEREAEREAARQIENRHKTDTTAVVAAESASTDAVTTKKVASVN